ncbi:condensation domain-containing protein [Micromonosporaceae bacterium B7E4]
MTLVEEAPLTYALELLTEIDGWLPGRVLNPRFLVHAAFEMDGPVQVPVLRAALDDVVARHGALRTVLARDTDGRRYQRVLPPMPARLAVRDLDPGTPAAEFVTEVCDRDHPDDAAPLLWAHLGRRGPERALLVLVAQHVAADAWSMTVLARDVAVAYTARLAGRAPWSEPVMQYTAIAEDDRSAKWQARIRQVQPYWRERLAGAAGLGVPAETPGRPGSSGTIATVHFTVDDELRRAVTEAARRARTTPFSLLLTAFTAAMYPPDGSSPGDALVPVITAGRIPSEWETVGFLLNTLLIRVDRSGGPDLAELRRRVDGTCRQAYANDIPLLTVLRAVPELFETLPRRDRVLPLFQLIPRTPVKPPPDRPALTLTPVATDRRAPAVIPGPLLWTMYSDDSLTGLVAYDTELFGESWVEQRAATFQQSLRTLAAAR